MVKKRPLSSSASGGRMTRPTHLLGSDAFSLYTAGTERGDQNEEGNESRLLTCFLWLPYGGNLRLGKESELKTIPTTLKLDQKSIERIMF